jgi:hypothetical protein
MKKTRNARGIAILLGAVIISTVCAAHGFSQPLEDPVRGALRRSLLHFSQVLNASQQADKSHIGDFLQAAIDEAGKGQDSKLSGVLERLRENFLSSGKLNVGIVAQAARMYNNYIAKYKWAYPLFDTANPLSKAPGGEPY